MSLAKGEDGLFSPPCMPGGNFNATRIAFRLQHISLSPSISLTLFFSLSLSLYPPASFSVSLLYAPRAASVDHALTAIKAAIFIAPV